MKIGIVGLGCVGLPLAIAFCEAGHEVVGVDTDARVADALGAGRSHVEDVSDDRGPLPGELALWADTASPVDPFYLAWRAREFDMQTEFIELAGEVNQRMPYFCVERISRALNDHSKSVRGSRIGIFGVSYKPGVGDLRESPALRIIRLLTDQGAEVVYHDDFVPDLPEHGLHSNWPEDVDCAVIVTAHPGLDLERVVRESPLVVDFRGVTRGIEASNLVRL